MYFHVVVIISSLDVSDISHATYSTLLASSAIARVDLIAACCATLLTHLASSLPSSLPPVHDHAYAHVIEISA
jgi:hypothetical protein